MLSAWGIMAGLTLLALSLGLQASLLGVRAGIEGFSTEVTGLIMSGYPVGLIAGIAIVPKLLPRMGHGPLFAFQQSPGRPHGIAPIRVMATTPPRMASP